MQQGELFKQHNLTIFSSVGHAFVCIFHLVYPNKSPSSPSFLRSGVSLKGNTWTQIARWHLVGHLVAIFFTIFLKKTQRFIYLTWIRNLLNKFYKTNFHLPDNLFYPLPHETYTLCLWLQVPAPCRWSMQQKFRRVSEAFWTDGLSEPERPRHRGWNDVPRLGISWLDGYFSTGLPLFSYKKVMLYNVCVRVMCFFISDIGKCDRRCLFPIHWSMKKEGYPLWFTKSFWVNMVLPFGTNKVWRTTTMFK